MEEYNHKKIEEKWQKIWEKKKVFAASNQLKKPKFYGLIEFPYPSGEGLHVGHIRSSTAMDIICRKRRMEGKNVLFPIGWDAFGLPTENYAIKAGIHPSIVTKKNTDTFRRQLKSFGFSFDWSREINTTDPNYYKWTQWIFLQLLKHCLAYKKKMPINWCPSCKIGLANEEVADGKCERCGAPVEKRDKEQWMLAITKYADRLDKDLDTVDYLPEIKTQQRNWIGKSEGALIKFPISNFQFSNNSKISNEGKLGEVEIFTTRPDTLFGAAYLVLAPEHSAIENWKLKIENWGEVGKYIKQSSRKTEMERTGGGKEKTGVELKGIRARNPANGEEIPVWIADYVLADYGTGAIMAVPAHDERDFEFAKKYDLPIKQVIAPYFTENPCGKDLVRNDKKTVRRKTAYALVWDKKNNKFLCLDWEKFGWHSGIIGGVEDGESFKDAALREIQEETGYINLKYVKNLGLEQHNHFFAAHKDENRYAMGQGILFELVDDSKENVSPEHIKNHKPVWIEAEKMESWLNLSAFKYIWESYKNNSECFIGNGKVINSGKFNRMNSEEAKWAITKEVGGKKVTKYKLRDWIFSRQHYWGEPIPVIYCSKCLEIRDSKREIQNKEKEGVDYVLINGVKHAIVLVPEKDLPVKLPNVEKYQPTDTGESPLSAMTKWVNTKCPRCGGAARRETDTMPNWAGSSWYYLRYLDPKNDKEFAGSKKLNYWCNISKKLQATSFKLPSGPVNWYNGGMEQVTLHLLYSRFWHKFLYDIGAVPTLEPYKKRTAHGLILAAGGVKMSKSKGNVINPDNLVKRFGADSLRLCEMFMGPFDQAIAWSEDGIVGTRRFLEKVWRIGEKLNTNLQIKTDDTNKKLGSLIHKTVKKTGEDIESMRFNTAVSALMICANEMEKSENIPKENFEMFLKILSPFAPHIAEELWHNLGRKTLISAENWPEYDSGKIFEGKITIIVQINGKVRGQFSAAADISESEVIEKAKSLPEIKKWLISDNLSSEGSAEKPIKKVFSVKGKLVNLVV